LHRLGNDEAAIATLRRALQLDDDFAEARIYLGNIHYDRVSSRRRSTTSIARRLKITGTS
jgi:hypothetical protein